MNSIIVCMSILHRVYVLTIFFFQAEDGIRDLVRSRGLGDVYKRQVFDACVYSGCSGWAAAGQQI